MFNLPFPILITIKHSMSKASLFPQSTTTIRGPAFLGIGTDRMVISCIFFLFAFSKSNFSIVWQYNGQLFTWISYAQVSPCLTFGFLEVLKVACFCFLHNLHKLSFNSTYFLKLFGFDNYRLPSTTFPTSFDFCTSN